MSTQAGTADVNLVRSARTMAPGRAAKYCLSVMIWACVASTLFPTGLDQGEEKVDYYRRWLEEDVVYIITEEEKSVFQKLTTPEEKDAFMEQFWLRRDPDPASSENSFKTEHYRRLAYANDHYTCGLEGWATDRGRIYIEFGPPKRVDRNPTGEVYVRSAEEGGGETMTYPYESWYYDHIEGIGSSLTLEFVDRSFSGDYKLALHPYEKDALLDKPGLGLTFAELEGRVSKQARLDSLIMQRGSYRDGNTWADRTRQPLSELEKYFELRRPPVLKYPDLQQVVNTRITYESGSSLRAAFGYQYLYLDADHCLVPVCFGLRIGDLTPVRDETGRMVVRVRIYGNVTDLERRLRYEFEDSLDQFVSSDQGRDRLLLYGKKIPLRPGRYKLTAVLREDSSNSTSVITNSLQIPPLQADQLSLSSVNLLSSFRKVHATLALTEPFVIPGGAKAYPNLEGAFDRSWGSMGVHFEVYNCTFAQDTGFPRVEAKLTIRDERGEVVLSQSLPAQSIKLLGTRIAVLHEIDLAGLSPRKYELSVSVRDDITGKQVSGTKRFSVVESHPALSRTR